MLRQILQKRVVVAGAAVVAALRAVRGAGGTLAGQRGIFQDAAALLAPRGRHEWAEVGAERGREASRQQTNLERNVFVERRPLVRRVVAGVEVDHFQLVRVDADEFVDDAIAVDGRVGQVAEDKRTHPFGERFQGISVGIGATLHVVHEVVGGQLPDGNVLC